MAFGDGNTSDAANYLEEDEPPGAENQQRERVVGIRYTEGFRETCADG